MITPDNWTRQHIVDRGVHTPRSKRVDAGQALTALDRCTADRFNGPWGDAQQDAAPGNLLRSALDYLGMTIAEFEAAPLVPERSDSLLRSDRAPVLTLGALVILRAADRHQRAGGAWSACVTAAERAARRYLSIIPVRMLPRGDEATATQPLSVPAARSRR